MDKKVKYAIMVLCAAAVLLAAAACLFAGFVRKSIPFDDPDRLIRTGVFLAAAAAAEGAAGSGRR